MDRAHLLLGWHLKATGQKTEAEAAFATAVQCNPDCMEAVRELKLLQQQRRR